MPELNADEQAIIDKARNMASTTSPVGGDEDGPPPQPATPSTPTAGIDEWGPYDDYFLITPSWGGSFGVPKGKILFFEDREVFVRRENQMKMVKIPHLRDPVTGKEAELQTAST